MPNYKAPLDDMRFVLHDVLNIQNLMKLPGYEETADPDTVNQFLEATAKFSEEALFPLNQSGDKEGCKYDPVTKSVTTPKGFKEAYEQFVAQGLTSLACDPEYGGMGMPQVVNTAIAEMFCSSNLSFGMYPGLSHGAYHALHEYGTKELKDAYLPKLVSGEWSGTMCLTEPQCGTDLGLIKTKAVKQGDGSYKITGEKIFISAGDHDLTSNICHLVLARIDDKNLGDNDKTPPGIKGISLFIVPKFMPDAKGEAGERNPVFCSGIEHKMGINGNATCAMSFEESKGFLVGEPHKGMKAMFVMMNEARQNVGLQGLGISEIAYQNALEYAQGRKQGTKMGDPRPDGDRVAIIEHSGVRKDLLTMKSTTEGSRMMVYFVAQQLDISMRHSDPAVREHSQKLVDLLTPVVKAHLTDNGFQNASLGMQIFGGHGFIKDWGMEQYVRDARITMLYEGTNGIQALDLIGRKVMQQDLLPTYFKEVEADIKRAKSNPAAKEFVKPLEDAMKTLKKIRWSMRLKGLKAKILGQGNTKLAEEAAAKAPDFLNLMSLTVMSHMWLKMADTAGRQMKIDPENKDFYDTKIKTARFYFARVLPEVEGLKVKLSAGVRTLKEIASEHFTHKQGTVAANPARITAPPPAP